MKYRILTVALAVLCLFTLAVPALANSAEPPMITVLVNNAPEDLTVTCIAGETEIPLTPIRRAWETYYRFYRSELPDTVDLDDAVFRFYAPSVGITVPCDMKIPYKDVYNTIVKLEILQNGEHLRLNTDESHLLLRNALLILLRVSLTLVTEGLILCLMGYRTKISWLTFLLTNLTTQTLLNLAITGSIPPGSYWRYGYTFGEMLIFLTEAIVFATFLREQSKPKAVFTALLANAVSLTCGYFLLSYLPI